MRLACIFASNALGGHSLDWAFMKRLLLLSLALVAVVGCGGNSGSNPVRYEGTYTGTWVNLENGEDQGTSTWTIESDGTVDGQDFDPGRETTFHVQGRIQSNGALTSTSTPTSGEPASLNGTLSFNNANQLTGTLVWSAEGTQSYRYTFTRNANQQ